jgi:hypothetical protein
MKQAGKLEKKFGILIYGKGTDPSTLLHFQLIMITHESSSYQVFHSFYEKIQSEFLISVKKVSSCYAYGGTNMKDHWPRKAKELTAL